jgi:hypothetical protein
VRRSLGVRHFLHDLKSQLPRRRPQATRARRMMTHLRRCSAWSIRRTRQDTISRSAAGPGTLSMRHGLCSRRACEPWSGSQVQTLTPLPSYSGQVDELMNYLESTCKPGTTVIIDESMQPWVGPNWREDSLVSKGVWRRHMSVEKGINVFVMHSWTKIWSCAGIRLGSVIAPTPQLMVQIKAKQVPWSVNNVALTFLTVAIACVSPTAPSSRSRLRNVHPTLYGSACDLRDPILSPALEA